MATPIQQLADNIDRIPGFYMCHLYDAVVCDLISHDTSQRHADGNFARLSHYQPLFDEITNQRRDAAEAAVDNPMLTKLYHAVFAAIQVTTKIDSDPYMRMRL